MVNRTPLPEGVRDLVSTDARCLSRLREQLLGEFRLWGYEEVVVPSIELGGSLCRDTYADELLYRLFDRRGRVLLLRPDITQSVARLATEQHDPALPLRYCYFGNAFRQLREGSGRSHEIWQAGFEIFGVSAPVADAEVVALGLDALTKVGVNSPTACIGHPVLAALLPQIPRLAPMNPKEVAAMDTGEWGPAALSPAAELKSLCESLIDLGVDGSCVIDLSLSREMDYYSGPVFEFYAYKAEGPLAGGGRYDGMCSRFGRALPATGLAIDVLQVMSLLSKSLAIAPDPPGGTLIGYEPLAHVRAQAIAHTLRRSGQPAELDSLSSSPEELVQKAAQKQRRLAVFVRMDGYEEYALTLSPDYSGSRRSGVAAQGYH